MCMMLVMKKYKKSLFLFHRDLRLADNTGLIEALEESEEVLPVFIFEEEQLGAKNQYRGENLVQFMLHSLEELNEQLEAKGGRLLMFEGKTAEILARILRQEKVEVVFSNEDYTPFALARDKELAKVCAGVGVEFLQFADVLLNKPGTVLKGDGSPYTVFTPFFRKARKLEVAAVQVNNFKNYASSKVAGEVGRSVFKKILPVKNAEIALEGGRKEALKLLKKIAKLQNYREVRNIPSVEGTTLLSAHNKFGTVSIREVFWKIFEVFGEEDSLMSEIYWRDFLTHIAFHFPHVFDGAFKKKYNHLRWVHDEKKFKKWCEGRTGYPLVDAGMRELNQTGYMHNRVRMVVASFLVKDLHLDWRLGERYFAQKLIDYDPAVNNGNWQWAASTGCDAQPYFRIFNPLRQQERFDKECVYIKRWVPELKKFTPKEIHRFEKGKLDGYEPPMVDHKEASAFAKDMFKGGL